MNLAWTLEDLRGFYYLIVYWFLKTFNIMAKIELYLIDLFNEQKVSIEKVRTHFNGDIECVEMVFYDKKDNDEIMHSFYLDKSTAIKFAKTLRTEINKIKEVDNV